MGYRKLSDWEIENLFGSKQRSGQSLMPIIEQWYEKPRDAASVIVTLDSEYNDETYEHRVQYVGVYDKSGGEIHPKRGKERDARKAMNSAVDRLDGIPGSTEDPVEEVVLRLSPVDLFVEA